MRYKVALLGCGQIAYAHAPAINTIENAVLDSAADINRKNLDAICDAYGVANRYAGLDALLEKGKPDIIIDATTPVAHLENMKKIARAGCVKGVLCEKPLSDNSVSAAMLVGIARKAGIKLMEGFMYLHHPRMRRAKEMVRNGALGTLQFIRATVTTHHPERKGWRFKKGAGGGCIYDLGGYCIGTARYFAGREPKRVFAEMTQTKAGVNESAIITLDFGGGLFAQLFCSYGCAHQEYVELYGTEAVMEMERYVVSVNMETAIRIKKLGWSVGRDERMEITFPLENVYALETANLIEAVDSNKRPLIPDNEGIKNLKVTEACVASAKAGKPVRLSIRK